MIESEDRIVDRIAQLTTELRDLLWLAPEQRPRVAISSCLLGEAVRWDGGNKLDQPLADWLTTWCERVAVCPEVEMGLSVPREPLIVEHGATADVAATVVDRLVLAGAGSARKPTRRLVERDTGVDRTEQMASFAQVRFATLTDLDGWILKSRSPSCGLTDVVIHADGSVRGRGAGLFGAAVRRVWPQLPIADERELASPEVRAVLRLAAEWSCSWRLVCATLPHARSFRALHRKLRGWWHELGGAELRRLERIVESASGERPGVAWSHYDATARAILGGWLARRRRGRRGDGREHARCS